MEYDQQTRKAVMEDVPILASFLGTALESLQGEEMEEALVAERDYRDTGTVEDVSDEIFDWASAYCRRFLIEADVPDETDHFILVDTGMSYEEIGATLYLSGTGTGIAFTDNHASDLHRRMEDWATSNEFEGLYFGDDGCVYKSSGGIR